MAGVVGDVVHDRAVLAEPEVVASPSALALEPTTPQRHPVKVVGVAHIPVVHHGDFLVGGFRDVRRETLGRVGGVVAGLELHEGDRDLLQHL